MKHFRIHHLGLDHLPLSTEYMCCAYTEKLVKMNRNLNLEAELEGEAHQQSTRGPSTSEASEITPGFIEAVAKIDPSAITAGLAALEPPAPAVRRR